MYYLGIKDDFDRGIRRINAGSADVFIDDPLFFHKKRYGFYPTTAAWVYTETLLWSPRPYPAVERFFDTGNYFTEFIRASSEGVR